MEEALRDFLLTFVESSWVIASVFLTLLEQFKVSKTKILSLSIIFLILFYLLLVLLCSILYLSYKYCKRFFRSVWYPTRVIYWWIISCAVGIQGNVELDYIGLFIVSCILVLCLCFLLHINHLDTQMNVNEGECLFTPSSQVQTN